MDRIEFISEYRPSHTYIFWDRPELERMSPREFVSYVDGLRQKGQSGRHELEQLIIRAEKYPDRFVSKSELKTIIQTIVKTPGLLYMNFLPYKEELGPTISVLKHQRLVSAIMTTLYVTLLKTMNKEVKIDISEPMELTSEFY